MESTKARGDLKLDVKDKKKLAPVQAYCSYAWASTLRPIVLARWEQQKATLTVADEDDPLADSGDPPEEACIPLSFKLEIAREIYDQLSQQEKDDIDVRREEDRQKIHRKITDIADDEERKEKLTLHLKYVKDTQVIHASHRFCLSGIRLWSKNRWFASSGI